MNQHVPSDFPAMTPETQAIWDQNATWWDEQIGDGNVFQNRLIGPASNQPLSTEPEWHKMLELPKTGLHRRACLLAIAWCRRDRLLMRDERSPHAVDWTEQVIDGLTTCGGTVGPSEETATCIIA